MGFDSIQIRDSLWYYRQAGHSMPDAAGTDRMRRMSVRAVIFDWGGTLTPWHSIDLGELWLAVCARHYPAEEAAANAAAVRAAEMELWRGGERCHQSATLERT